MARKSLIISIFFLTLGALFYFFLKKESPSTSLSPNEFFVPVPIAKFSARNTPFIEVEIEGQIFLMMLDLGLSNHLCVKTQFWNQISNKKFLDTNTVYGMKGGAYLVDHYEIPEMAIGDITFMRLMLYEEGKEAQQESIISQYEIEDFPDDYLEEIGAVGWETFYHSNLFLDLKNGEIAFCDSFETLLKEIPTFKDSVKVPFSTENGLIECKGELKGEPLSCIIDTGCTKNFLNTPLNQGQTIAEMAWDPTSEVNYSSFKLGSRDFGPITFIKIPISFPFKVGAMLGMDFFFENLVFIDFKNKHVYFQENES